MCTDGGSSFAAVLFCGHEVTLVVFEVLLFGLTDLIWHNYFLDAAVTFFVMEVSSFHCFSVTVSTYPVVHFLLHQDIWLYYLLSTCIYLAWFVELFHAFCGCYSFDRILILLHTDIEWLKRE